MVLPSPGTATVSGFEAVFCFGVSVTLFSVTSGVAGATVFLTDSDLQHYYYRAV